MLEQKDIVLEESLYLISFSASTVKVLLSHLADKVQDAVMAYGGRFDEKVGTGAYGLPTSAIDRAAESAVLAELEKRGERLNVLSEEAGFIDRGGDLTLVLDPVDGTHNAERGVPFYSTSMAIGRGSMTGVTHALVRNLVSGSDFYASKGEGAFLDDKRIQVRKLDERDMLFSVYIGKNAHESGNRVASKGRRARSLGAASLEICMVASGALDLYYMNSSAKNAELRVVDIAAGALILREAGGEVVDLDRKRLDMPFDTKTTSNLIAYGDPRVLELIA
jgi:fructose-1,6-bisphosphatase/inositol monophosphatase family enzyme